MIIIGQLKKYYNIVNLIILIFIIYLFCSMWGYGNDNDTYALLRSGKFIIEDLINREKSQYHYESTNNY
jgi:hypothetical protein